MYSRRLRRTRKLCLEFDAASTILSAHCDGLVFEDQLTCGAQIMYKGRRDWRARKVPDGA